MHQYLENVRNEIEAAAGQESYLASALFYRIYKEMPYEDDGDRTLSSKEDYELVQHRVTNILNRVPDFDLDEEVLSWQISVLRHLARDFHKRWVDYKEDRFSSEDLFSDGESCLAIEASCERIKEDPTENYTAILEVERSLIKLATCPNQINTELDRFWKFKSDLTAQGEEITAFAEKRIEVERRNTMLAGIIRSMRETSARCLRNARQLPGAHHLLWIHAHIELESYLQTLDSFLDFEHLENLELSLTHWLSILFPQRVGDNLPSALYMSATHQEVMARLTQASQCMVEYVVRKKDAFTHRDEIIIPHLIESLEKVKKVSMQNIQVLKQDSQEADQARL